MNTVRLKVRDLEFEATGFDTFAVCEPLLNRAIEIWKEGPRIAPATAISEKPPQRVREGSSSPSDLSVNSFAARLSGDSCRDLLKICGAYLAIVKGQERFSRDDLVSTAKSSSRWKKNYTNQVASNIQRMISQSELIENATDVFTLPDSIVEQVRAQL
jgi:hypothetical protein